MSWTFMTNHAHVLMVIAGDPQIRLRDVADKTGITERAAQRIVSDLVDAGYLTRTRHGRRNRYSVNASQPVNHPLLSDVKVGSLIALAT